MENKKIKEQFEMANIGFYSPHGIEDAKQKKMLYQNILTQVKSTQEMNERLIKQFKKGK